MEKKPSLSIGSKAPAFSLLDAEGNDIALKDQSGRWLVLYFYPKDNTSGCTTEAIDFTAMKESFSSLNATVIGISPDSCESHKKFSIKYDLGITLLSDSGKSVLKKYGVWQQKQMYGKSYYGVERTTYLIDPAGKIRRIWNKVKVKGHAEDVLATLKSMID